MSSTQESARRRLRRLVWATAGASLAGLFAALALRFGSHPDPDGLRREAAVALKAQHFDRALVALDRLARIRPFSATDRLLRAEALAGLGHVAEALDDLSRVPDTDPMAARARLGAGYFELWQRYRTRTAEAFLLQALALDPREVEARRNLIRLFDIQGRLAERNAEYRALAEVTPLSMNDLLSWCRVKRPDGETNEVVILLQRFLQGDPDDHRSRRALAGQLRRLGRLTEAETLLSRLPETDPEVLAIRARIALDRGDQPTAEALLTRDSAGSAELDRLRGHRALLRGDARAAWQAYQAAYKAEPDHRDTLLGLGQACRLLGDGRAAAPWLQSAACRDALEALVQQAVTARNSHDPKLLNEVGAACKAAGRLDQARAWYRFTLTLDPLNSRAQQALYRLAAGAEQHSTP